MPRHHGGSGVRRVIQGAFSTSHPANIPAHDPVIAWPSRVQAGEVPTTPRTRRVLRLAITCCLAAVLLGGGGHLLIRVAGLAIDVPGLNESSGLVASHRNPGVLWSHNDSGRGAELFAFTDDGLAVATLTLPGVDIGDWEDLALGPDANGEAFRALYVGDIGDNGNSREYVSIFRVPEPDLSEIVPGEPVVLTAGDIDRFDLTYDDGPRDAEALLVDPVDGAVLIATKTPAGTAALYRAELTGDPTAVVLARQTDVAVPGVVGLTRLVTGGTISPARDRVVLRTYVAGWWWPVAPGQSVAEAMTAIPERIALPLMRQGEAITFSADGETLYVSSEGSPALLGSVPAPANDGP